MTANVRLSEARKPQESQARLNLLHEIGPWSAICQCPHPRDTRQTLLSTTIIKTATEGICFGGMIFIPPVEFLHCKTQKFSRS